MNEYRVTYFYEDDGPPEVHEGVRADDVVGALDEAQPLQGGAPLRGLNVEQTESGYVP